MIKWPAEYPAFALHLTIVPSEEQHVHLILNNSSLLLVNAILTMNTSLPPELRMVIYGHPWPGVHVSDMPLACRFTLTL